MQPLRELARPRATAGPPRARELPVVGSLFDLVQDPLAFLERISREHGDEVEFTFPGQRVWLFSHPDAIDDVLVHQRDHLVKDKLTRDLDLLIGRGLLVSEGAFWRRQRMLAMPAFHRERIAAYGDVMVSFAECALGSFRDGEVRDVHVDMMRLTLDIVARTLFGAELGAVSDRIGSSLHVLMTRFAGLGQLVPIAVPTPANLRARRAIEQLDEVVYGLIRRRRREGDSGDLLSMLIRATSEDGHGMDDQTLRDEAMTLLVAGHETTALTLGYTLDLLARHPEADERLARELAEVLGDRPATSADLPRLAYADAVIRESMRLYPPAWAVGREAVAPCRIAGHRVEPGTQLWVAQWIVHRDARWFTDPLAFRPERWAGSFAKTLPKHAYFPFGGGPRICIGNAFAMMEAVLVLATLARRFRFERVDATPLAVQPTVTLRPRNGVRLRVRARRAMPVA